MTSHDAIRNPWLMGLVADREARVRSGTIAYQSLGKLRSGEPSGEVKATLLAASALSVSFLIFSI